METTLRMFYARALGLAFLIAVLLVAMVFLAAPAFAQAATAPAQPGVLDLFATSASAGLASILAIGSAYVLKQLPSWARTYVEAKVTTESKDWHIYTEGAVNRAKAYAEKKMQGARDSSKFVDWMVRYLHAYEPEIVRWADKNGDGVLDFLEPFLPDHVRPKPPTAETVSSIAPRKVTRAAGEKVN